MDSMRLIAKRNSDGFTVYLKGEGRSIGDAWIDVAQKANEALCPDSETPGYEWTTVAMKLNDEPWRECVDKPRRTPTMAEMFPEIAS